VIDLTKKIILLILTKIDANDEGQC
jgi:hypothetical protein